MASKASADAVWPLKEINYPPRSDRRIKIVYQRRNGPCSLLAICNILILRGDVEIQPPGRRTASYEYLSSLVADFLVNTHGALNDADLTAALAVLPSTQEGMDLNPLFTGLSSFRPEGSGGELKLFELCNILLVHGWLVDPQSPEHEIVSKAEDYDTALNMIVAGEEASAARNPNSDSSEAQDADTHLRDALVLRQFLEQNSTQLTFHGLWSLYALDKGLYALIRNSHLSVLHKYHPAGEEPSLWTLVTDSNLVPEPSIVWESLEDVDGAASRFVDSDLFPSSTLGGDFAGRPPEPPREPSSNPEYDADLLLAQQLQAQEDELALQLEQTDISDNAEGTITQPNEQRVQSNQQPNLRVTQPPLSSPAVHSEGKPLPQSDKKKKDCIVM